MGIHKHADQERMHELCSLAVLGEIGPEDMLVLSAHLEVCPECRKLANDLDELTRMDLSAAAAAHIQSQPLHDLDPSHEAELLSRLVSRVEGKITPNELLRERPIAVVPPCRVPLRHRIRNAFAQIYPVAGWVTAGALAVILIASYSRKQPVVTPALNAAVAINSSLHDATPNISRPNESTLRSEAETWKLRALEAEKENAAAHHDLEASKLQMQASSQSFAEVSAKYQESLTEKQQIEAQLAAQDAKLRQQTSALNLAQTNADEERSEAATLRAQLQEVSQHLDQQRSEMARLQEVAATVPARLPIKVSDENPYDGREIFGARDLHIVDVYDVDQAGKASRTYGRVYYVNRSLLLFYAFDLDHNAKLRKPVAFQAWGFRQPNSKTAESLGLFYLEDPKLDRWTLRVSDPRLLARIDSLFVTVEPPGGSNAPRGRQLLFASLSGPPNHP